MEPPVQGCGIMSSTTFLKLVTVLAMAYFGVKLWTLHYDPASGRLCTFHDRHACVTSALSKVLLTVSRMSAGALLPSMACCILSKCYATRYFLHHSWLALVVSFEPAHELHTYFGSLTLLFGVLHGLAHLAREVNEGHWNCFASSMGRSGFIALVLLFPIAVPMLLGRPKKLMTFEFRKALHMLFIPFMVAMCFHGKVLAVLAGILVAWYLVDRTYFTTRIGYQFKVGSYIQVNCPAISAKEWHPFSMFPVPGPRPRGGFYVEAVGDWTQELFRLSLDDPCMPLWITAAQPSVLEKSVYFENVIMVCTGAGITPAICLADMLSKKKNVHLMWLSREAGMVATFEKQLRRVNSTVHLTGKPTEKTKQRLTDLLAHSKAPPPAETGSSCSDPTDLEAGFAAARSRNDDFDDGAYGAGGDMEDLGGCSSNRRNLSSAGGGMSGNRSSGGGGGGGKRLRRTPFGKPISLNFGRPDIEKFLTETIRGSSSSQHEKWAATGGPPGKIVGAAAVGDSWQPQQNASKLRASPPPSTGRHAEKERDYSDTSSRDVRKKVLARLNTNQRISKRDLMSADLSVVPGKASPPRVPRSGRVTAAASDMGSPDGVGGGGGGASGAAWDARTWLVLYCGANAKVEEAVETACDDLCVTWRKEYFSAW
ncbi:putative respiratory burst oxidase homolog [Ectocarpus siliculosus]|uniref:Respiratory burst oxidase homolog n=1 Tax=Ectocarpus siliculosus TaxID=2880 RepID=D7G8C4_ECTSI|nr:putative respiratory burst oxidase homolog [Ectocarpus siliculosus]|eukprot:CBJ27976.1 putative respiratory burst oxidase homolog [Ectocarpus siliculosus]